MRCMGGQEAQACLMQGTQTRSVFMPTTYAMSDEALGQGPFLEPFFLLCDSAPQAYLRKSAYLGFAQHQSCAQDTLRALGRKVQGLRHNQ